MRDSSKKSSAQRRAKQHVGFGGQLKRFRTQGLHPALLRSVETDSSPCDYNPQLPPCVRRPNINNWEPWKVRFESEEYSKNLGYEHGPILEYRAFMTHHLGPGTHDIDPAIFHQAEVSPCKNQNFSRQKRFRHFDDISPGSARYAVKPYNPKVKHVGNTVERAARFRDPDPSWALSCNRYRVFDMLSMDALIRKVVSLRGPYDLFTGPREPTNIFNKFAPGKSVTPDKYYSWPSDISRLLDHSTNRMKGKFSLAKRFLEKPCARNMLDDLSLCYRDPREPGPPHYDIPSSIVGRPQQLYPFALTGPDVRPPIKWLCTPGPGRYNLTPVKCAYTHRRGVGTSVFVSKTQRTEYKAPAYNAF